MAQPDNEARRFGANFFIEQSRNKGLARQLAVLQSKLVGGLQAICEHNQGRSSLIDISRQGDELWVSCHIEFQGISDIPLLLIDGPTRRPAYWTKVGVDTSTSLNLGLYTNRETWEAVRKHDAYNWEERFGFTLDEVKKAVEETFSADEVDEMTFPNEASSDNYSTYYFVDETGAYAKVVSLPEDMAQGRPDLQIESHPIDGTVTVQVPMLARDFVIMKSALDQVAKRLDSLSSK